ncbi:DEAD/DEAH box helicase [Aureivirga sp. CE67]|uniref:DEAD/DEAH box helicase n=1 Tax=Aureivirga sp. CE67 TaxID=1788983 RepID=UPI0018C98272|nr:DEAD/DEAH box helicase [Aureivirga sp. CE67]
MQQKKTKNRNRGNRKKMVSSIDPKTLVKKANFKKEKKYISSITFKDLNLHHKLEKNIIYKGYKKPTEIQEKSIPSLISKKDLIGIAATGTGKTGSFLIPIIHQMLENKNISALVVVPTRELALQVQDEYHSLTKGLKFISSCFIGGTNINKDIIKAKRKNQFIVATPGRLNDLVKRKALKLSNTSILVLDEFDRMLDMGFINDVRKISNATAKRSQTILFSATVDKSQESLIREFVKSPIRINVTSGTKSSDNVHQDIIKVEQGENKFDVLLDLLNDKAFKKVILFAETKRTADKISRQLRNSGMLSDTIHGGKSQNYRSKVIDLFKTGKTKILVATDVAARGIDINNVTHVINYQLPMTMDSYIHRIGRTGRAGKVGTAYTFIN